MGAPEGLIAHVDQVIEYFNRRKLDLPDGFFDRKTQFVINGAPFETLLSTAPNDPLVLMLARGPAGYRFTVKALQHAVPDAKIERGDLITDGDPLAVTTRLWLSGELRGTGEKINTLIAVALRLTEAGLVDVAAATIEPATLEKIKEARAQP
jgi:hypothetical protein